MPKDKAAPHPTLDHWMVEDTSNPASAWITLAGYRDDVAAALPLITCQAMTRTAAMQQFRAQAAEYDRRARVA
jgi:hypothetical protein